MNDVYDHPQYYEIAFSFRDVAAEVDVIDEVIGKFSDIPVSTILDLGCGPAQHLSEFIHRGYQYIGLDLSPAMIAYAQNQATMNNLTAKFKTGNMVDFQLDQQVDFALILLGSLQISSTKDLISHFDCLARALKPGGIFFLDWCIEFNPRKESVETWEMEQGEIKVKTTFQTKMVNPAEQIYLETITLDVMDQNNRKEFNESSLQRSIYPQEFLLFIESRSDFKFIGWWNNWDLSQPLEECEQITRPITILKRT
jgi:SAM-dependent methyltransferase